MGKRQLKISFNYQNRYPELTPYIIIFWVCMGWKNGDLQSTLHLADKEVWSGWGSGIGATALSRTRASTSRADSAVRSKPKTLSTIFVVDSPTRTFLTNPPGGGVWRQAAAKKYTVGRGKTKKTTYFLIFFVDSHRLMKTDGGRGEGFGGGRKKVRCWAGPPQGQVLWVLFALRIFEKKPQHLRLSLSRRLENTAGWLENIRTLPTAGPGLPLGKPRSHIDCGNAVLAHRDVQGSIRIWPRPQRFGSSRVTPEYCSTFTRAADAHIIQNENEKLRKAHCIEIWEGKKGKHDVWFHT